MFTCTQSDAEPPPKVNNRTIRDVIFHLSGRPRWKSDNRPPGKDVGRQALLPAALLCARSILYGPRSGNCSKLKYTSSYF